MADLAGVKKGVVLRWARNHGVQHEIEGMDVVYAFTDEQVEAFLNRDKKRGRRWAQKDSADQEKK